MLRISHEFIIEVSNFLKEAFLSPTQLFALKKGNSEIYDSIGMMSCGNSTYLGQPMIFPLTKEISEHDKRMLTPLHAWARLRKYWKIRNFRGEVYFHLIQSCPGQDQLQRNIMLLQHVILKSNMSKRRAIT